MPNPLYDFPKDEQQAYALPVERPVVETPFAPVAVNDEGQPLKKVYITGKPEPKLVAVEHDPFAVSDPATGFTGEMKTGPKPTRKNWMMEPDLVSQGMGELPEGVTMRDDGKPVWKDTGQELEVIRRPGVLPFAKTPDGVEFVMPKLLDAAVVGKEAAKKLFENRNQHGAATLAGQDLKIGGEGMKGFYDQIIPKSLEKIGKEHGVKVKYDYIQDPYWHENVFEKNGITQEQWLEATPKQRDEWIKKVSQRISYIDIPQSMKNAALRKGQPLFSVGIPYPLMPVEHDPFNEKSK